MKDYASYHKELDQECFSIKQWKLTKNRNINYLSTVSTSEREYGFYTAVLVYWSSLSDFTNASHILVTEIYLKSKSKDWVRNDILTKRNDLFTPSWLKQIIDHLQVDIYSFRQFNHN